jgi:hypothetical protein
MELRIRHSPSIPTDRPARDIYLVLEDFRQGAAWRETDEPDIDFPTLINDLLTGQCATPRGGDCANPRIGKDRRSQCGTEYPRATAFL